MYHECKHCQIGNPYRTWMFPPLIAQWVFLIPLWVALFAHERVLGWAMFGGWAVSFAAWLFSLALLLRWELRHLLCDMYVTWAPLDGRAGDLWRQSRKASLS